GNIAEKVRTIFPKGVDRIQELVGTRTLLDSLQATAPKGVVCMTGMLGNAWSLANFEPMMIPSSVKLTTYQSETLDMSTAVRDLPKHVHLCSRLLDRSSETWYIYVVGYIVLEDEMGDSKIDKEGTEEYPFPNGGKNMTTQSESTATTRSIWKLDPNHTLVEFS